MDKLTLTNHIRDIDLKNKMFKVIDKANGCMKNYDVRFTEFMNPFEVTNATSILNSYTDIKYGIDGGFNEAERSVVSIYPYYMESDDVEAGIRFLQVEGNFKFKSISHKDYLGAILNLGIKREKIGDIIIHDEFCQVVVDKDICDFVIMNLEKVSRNTVKVTEISRDDLIMSDHKYKEKSMTVQADRLDCVISAVYDISRQDSLKYISANKVHVNFESISSKSKSIKSGDLISVRGKGRVEIEDIGELTKKGRLKLKVRLLV
jgi:RNA-binding protein YlmH